MEFFEFVLVFSIVFVLPLTILKTIMDYKKAQFKAERSGIAEREGVTAGELKRLLREVVEEANQPLLERIEGLERERSGLPPSASLDPLFDAEEEMSLDDEAEKTLGRRLRG